MNLAQKKIFVENLRSNLQESKILLIAHYAGLTVDQVNSLRSNAKKNDVKVKVAKNSLTKLAIEGTEYAALNDQLAGPVMLIFAEDVVSAAKILVGFAKENEDLAIHAGSYNDSLMAKEDIINLSKMPSLDELRAKIISIINTPATRVACVLGAPATKCTRVFKAYSEKTN